MPREPLDPLDFISGSFIEAIRGNEGQFKLAAPMFLQHGTRIRVKIASGWEFWIGVKKDATPVPNVQTQMDLYNKPNTSLVSATEFAIAWNALPWPDGPVDVPAPGGGFQAYRPKAWVDPDRIDTLPPEWGQFTYVIMQSHFNEDTDQSHDDPNQAHVISPMRKAARRGGQDIASAITACVTEATQVSSGAQIKMTGGDYSLLTSAGLFSVNGKRDTFIDIDFGNSIFWTDGGNFDTGGDLGRMVVRNGIQCGRSALSHDGTFAFRIGGYTNAGLLTLKNWDFAGWQDGPVSGVTRKPGSALWVDAGHVKLDNIGLYGCTAKRCVVSIHKVQNVIGRRLNFYDDGVVDGEARVKNGAPFGWPGIANGLQGPGSGTLQARVRFEDCWFDENYGAGFDPANPTLSGGISFNAGLIPPGHDDPYDADARVGYAELVNVQGRISNQRAGYGVGVLARSVDVLEMRGCCIQRDAGLGQNFATLENVKAARLFGCRGNPDPNGGDHLTFYGNANEYYWDRGCKFASRRLAAGASAPTIYDVID